MKDTRKQYTSKVADVRCRDFAHYLRYRRVYIGTGEAGGILGSRYRIFEVPHVMSLEYGSCSFNLLCESVVRSSAISASIVYGNGCCRGEEVWDQTKPRTKFSPFKNQPNHVYDWVYTYTNIQYLPVGQRDRGRRGKDDWEERGHVPRLGTPMRM